MEPFFGRPPLVKAATGEEVTADELGGKSTLHEFGVTDHYAQSEEEALHIARNIIENLNLSLDAGQLNNRIKSKGPKYPVEEIYGVSKDTKKPFDVRGNLDSLTGVSFRVQENFWHHACILFCTTLWTHSWNCRK